MAGPVDIDRVIVVTFLLSERQSGENSDARRESSMCPVESVENLVQLNTSVMLNLFQHPTQDQRRPVLLHVGP
jgi:hypothetical protein